MLSIFLPNNICLFQLLHHVTRTLLCCQELCILVTCSKVFNTGGRRHVTAVCTSTSLSSIYFLWSVSIYLLLFSPCPSRVVRGPPSCPSIDLCLQMGVSRALEYIRVALVFDLLKKPRLPSLLDWG